jgi:hypothetical protein
VAISFASLRSRSSGILNVLTTYASGAFLSRALDCSLLPTAHSLTCEERQEWSGGRWRRPTLHHSSTPSSQSNSWISPIFI